MWLWTWRIEYIGNQIDNVDSFDAVYKETVPRLASKTSNSIESYVQHR